MPEILALLHSAFNSRKTEAKYLGYSEKGYFNIRKLIERGEPLLPRVEDHLRLKASQLTAKKKEFYCDCPYKANRS